MGTSQTPPQKPGPYSPRAIVHLSHGHSAYCPYPVTSFFRRKITDPNAPDFGMGDDHSQQADHFEFDTKYLKMISPPWNKFSQEIQHLIRKELQLMFFEMTTESIRDFDEYMLVWRTDIEVYLPRVELPPLVNLEPDKITHFLNKEVMIYVDVESIGLDDYGKIGRFIFREWLHLHDRRPIFQRESFVAAPMQLDQSFKSLKKISEFHANLYEAISPHLDDDADFYPGINGSETIPPPHFQPIPSKRVQSFRDHGYTIRPLLRALYMVIDDQALQATPPFRLPGRIRPDTFRPRDERVLNHRISYCTVLLIRTGEETHLSSPISFLPLFEAGLALNVDRQDYEDKLDPTVVRVNLNVALRFIQDLLNREEESNPEFAFAAKELRQEQEEWCQSWVGKVICHSQEVGMDTGFCSWMAVRRALAKMNNEAFDMDQVYPPWEKLRSWHSY
ncbi:hypothetical protein FSHL1_006584 [Fusarium sambucinum]